MVDGRIEAHRTRVSVPASPAIEAMRLRRPAVRSARPVCISFPRAHYRASRAVARSGHGAAEAFGLARPTGSPGRGTEALRSNAPRHPQAADETAGPMVRVRPFERAG